MSIGSTWVKCADGKWYEDPEWRGYSASGEREWFLELDDTEPAELVVRADCETPKLEWFGLTKGKPRERVYKFGKKSRLTRVYNGRFIGLPTVPQRFRSVRDDGPR